MDLKKITGFMNGKSFIWFICCIGCSYQLANLILRYFRFEVRTDTIQQYPEVIEVPEMDFYFPLGTLLNISAVYERYPDKLASICNEIFRSRNASINSLEDFEKYCSDLQEAVFSIDKYLFSVLTVGDIEDLTDDPRPFIGSIYTLETKENYLETGICKMNRYLNAGGIFIRVYCRNDSIPLSFKYSHGSGGNNFFLYIEHSIDVPFAFRFANHDDCISHHPQKYEIMKKSIGEHFTIITYFHRQVQMNQPWPSSNPCLEYNRMIVLAKCLNASILNSPPYSFYDVILPFGVYPRNTQFVDPYSEPTGQFLNFFKNCSQFIVKPSCLEIEYFTTCQVYHDQVLVQSPRMILVDAPNEPDRILKANFKSEADDLSYSCYSVLGIWFGFNIYDKWTSWNKKGFCCSKGKKRRKKDERKRPAVSQLKIIREIEIDI